VVDGITVSACRGGYTASACDDQVEAARWIGGCCVLADQVRCRRLGTYGCGAWQIHRCVSQYLTKLGQSASQVGTSSQGAIPQCVTECQTCTSNFDLTLTG
jgi:hypothetical protein